MEGPDFESAVILRHKLLPIFDKATTWTELIDALKIENLGLSIKGGRLILINQSDGTWVCTGRFLGNPLAALVSKLGKPHVRPHSGTKGNGEFLRGARAPHRRAT